MNINECDSGPCQNGATCLDGINNYTCTCSPGYSGRDCEVNIDDCEPEPCLHGGVCVDGVNLYTCNCNNTGYTGDNCEQDIDECAVAPCLHNSTCINLVNDYNCTCWSGYEGKNCSVDIKECESGPCQNNATCFERSDVNLYNQDVAGRLPTGIKDYFLEGFSYDNAAGYLCNCPKGFEGNEPIAEPSNETVYKTHYGANNRRSITKRCIDTINTHLNMEIFKAYL